MIVRDDGSSRLERIHTGRRVNQYRMTVNGWYGGGFSAPSDTEAIAIYKRIIQEEREAATV